MKEKLFKTMRMFLALLLVVTLIVPTVSIPSEAASKLSTPKLVSVSNTSSDVTVKWKKVSNASGYYVYRKTGRGKWSKIATIKKNSTVSYADKKAAAGKTYTYTVKAYKGKTTSSYNKKGLTIKRLTQPSVSVKNTSSGVKISWKKVTGASKYRVYYKADGKWKKLADTTSTSYTDTSVRSGSSRTYTVKAISGSYNSSYHKGKVIKYLAQPAPFAENTDIGVKVTWSKVTGASKYRIYRKTAGTSWQKLADTTSTSYTDSTAVSGTEYYYTVKALSGSYSSSYTSSLRITYTAVHVHSYTSSVTKAATCDTNGVKTYTCSCGDSYTEVIKATGHSYTSKVTKAATCDTNGVRTYTCSRCGDSYTETIKATGHNWEEQTEKQWVVDGKVWVVDQEAYDEEVITGYDEYYECTSCKEKWHFSNDEEQDAAHDAWFEHVESGACPAGGGSYTYKKDPIYETVHHDEEGHFEETGHYEDVVTGYKCSKCGATK